MTADHNPGDVFPVGTTLVTYTATDEAGDTAICSFNVTVQDDTPPAVGFSEISAQLDDSGTYNLSASDLASMLSGSMDNCGIAYTNVNPSTFTFCDVGHKLVVITLTDIHGNCTNYIGTIRVIAPINRPANVYVNAKYGAVCQSVSFPSAAGTCYIGYNAFNTIQAGLDAVAENGTVQVASGTYIENLSINKSLSLLGPNTGKSGSSNRVPEAVVLPAFADPESMPIVSVTANNVTIDGFLLDGCNSMLEPGDAYVDGNGQPVLFAAAGIQNGIYPDLADINHLAFQNCIVRNVSYGSVYLDRTEYYTAASTGNFITNNQFENAWDGVFTYALHAVIAHNTITNVNRGISVHGTITSAAPFTPAITNNLLTIGQWWPHEFNRLRAIGIWVNYRRDHASPLCVADNLIVTPVPAPPNATLRALEALTIDGSGSVSFSRNIVNGGNNCQQGIYAAGCWSNSAVQVLGGSLNGVQAGVVATTKDVDFGNGDAVITISNLVVHSVGGTVGILVDQDSATPDNHARIDVLSNCSISGFLSGVHVQGANAAASILNNSASISDNAVGVEVENGKVLLENNNLTGNTVAAVRVGYNGIVDAGDCAGSNVTGLGSGTGLNHSSAGGNNLSGYGFPATGRLAVQNTSSWIVKAEQNDFGATATDNIATIVAGAVDYAQAGAAYLSCPPEIRVETVDQIPAGAGTVAEFIRLGGCVWANGGTITYGDEPVIRIPGNQTVLRSYAVTNECGQGAWCSQRIVVKDTTVPTIIRQPQSVTTDIGCRAAFSVGVKGAEPMTYGWQKDGRSIASATESTYSIPAVAASDAGSYRVVIGNANGLKVSKEAMLTLITEQPRSVAQVSNSTVRFSVTVSGLASSYQWEKGGVVMLGATGSGLTLDNIGGPDAGGYRVVISNTAGRATSEEARLTVVGRPGLKLVGYADLRPTISISGTAGFEYGIRASTNFVDWLNLVTNAAPYTFTDTGAAGLEGRFYEGFWVRD